MDRVPWVHFFGPKDPAGQKAVFECLSAAGIRCRPFNPHSATGDGIICTSQFDEESCEFLRAFTHDDRQRVLAIQTSSTVADGSMVWRLLLAGASDVLVWSTAPDIAERVKARFERWHAVDALVHSAASADKLVGVSGAWRALLRQVDRGGPVHPGFRPADRRERHRQGAGGAFDSRPRSFVPTAASSWSWIARPSCRNCRAANSSATSAAPSPARSRPATALLRPPTAGRCFSTRSASCRCRCRRSCCGSCRRAPTSGSAATCGTAAGSGSSARPTGTCRRRSSAAQFRNDLYYRIASWVFRVPPLQERREDILPLARHFLRTFRPDNSDLDFDPAVRDYLLSRPYPGNVRDLRQLIARISSRHVGPGPITVGDIPVEERSDRRQRRAQRLARCRFRAAISATRSRSGPG